MSEASKTKQESSGLGRAPSNVSQGVEDNTIAHDAVFGNITADGPNYRNVRNLTVPGPKTLSLTFPRLAGSEHRS